MQDLAVFAEESSLFASPFLAEALDVPLYTILPQYNDFFQAGKRGVNWKNGSTIKERNLIIVGYNALQAISMQIKRFNRVAYVACDSWSCKYYKWINEFISQNNITLYAMPDLGDYYKNFIPAYQRIRIKNVNETKYSITTIAHSPNNHIKAHYKGTNYIVQTIEKLKRNLDIYFVLIQGLPMTECLLMKARSHIFVDQLIYGNPEIPQDRFGGEIRYNGGLGKSGIEAMMLDCCVITGGRQPDTEKYFPPPPVVWSHYDTLYDDLEELINYSVLRNNKARKQRRWVDEYLTPEFVRNHFTRFLNE